METSKAIENRRSYRAYNLKPVPRAVLEKLADAGRLATTARNVQPWEFVVITSKATLEKLGPMIDNGKFLPQCGACIAVLCSDTKYYLEDGCAATENILIAAVDAGLASCWIAGDKKDYALEVKKILGVPGNFKLVSLVALGYSDTQAQTPPKRSLKEVLHWETYKKEV